MKNINELLKKTVFLCVAAGLMLAGTNVYAQREALTNDELAGVMQGVINTGTDVILIDNPKIIELLGAGSPVLLQVMVSDGDHSNLYWSF